MSDQAAGKDAPKSAQIGVVPNGSRFRGYDGFNAVFETPSGSALYVPVVKTTPEPSSPARPAASSTPARSAG